MHEIICPHCGKAFKIDEAGYADILKQIRDSEFDKQLHERLELAEQDKRNAVELAQTKVASELQKSAAAKDAEIQEMKARLDAGEVARKLDVTEALSAVEKSVTRSRMPEMWFKSEGRESSDRQLLHCKAVIRQQSGTAARLHFLPLALVSQVKLIDWWLDESVFKSVGIGI